MKASSPISILMIFVAVAGLFVAPFHRSKRDHARKDSAVDESAEFVPITLIHPPTPQETDCVKAITMLGVEPASDRGKVQFTMGDTF